MKYTLLFVGLILISCTDQTESPVQVTSPIIQEINIENNFQSILDTAGVIGSILILQHHSYFTNDSIWANQGQLPASTFKIPNSIIAMELGVMKDESSIIEWDGKPRYFKEWEADLSFKEAFHFSCVPCYQEIARNIGAKNMNSYLEEFNYGNIDCDTGNLDQFWLEGTSIISQFEQIDFLKAFNEHGLPISDSTYTKMSNLMIIEQNELYTLRGKTGWSRINNKDNLWFVGYVETDAKTYYFATNIEPGENTDLNQLRSLRKEVTYKALRSLGVKIST